MFLELLMGAVVGYIYATAKNKKKETENEKLSKPNKDTQQVEDELDDAKRQVNTLTAQNDELVSKIKEYKVACESYEDEISQLKRQDKNS